jgi:hypothetical protein
VELEDKPSALEDPGKEEQPIVAVEIVAVEEIVEFQPL